MHAGVQAIAAGSYLSMALKSDGTVWTTGKNDHGQLGDGTTTNRAGYVQAKGVSGQCVIHVFVVLAPTSHNTLEHAYLLWTRLITDPPTLFVFFFV